MHSPEETACLGYAGVGALIDEAEAEHGAENVTVVDAGDAVQGGPVGTLTEGKALVDLMNAVGYDYAVPGNHEFDYGMDRFNELLSASNATYLSCNFVDENGSAVLAPYHITTYDTVSDGAATTTLDSAATAPAPVATDKPAAATADSAAPATDSTPTTNEPTANNTRVADAQKAQNADGVLKVAYVGITAPETLTKSSPTSFQDDAGNYIYGFCQDTTGAALYQAVQNAVDAAYDEGADYVVAIGHLGNSGITSQWTSKAVIANTTGIDAFIDGHSHETYNTTATNKQGEDVLLAQTGTKLANAGELTINPSAPENLTFFLTSAETYTQTAPDIQNAVDAINAEFNALLGQVVGSSKVDLLSEDYDTNLYVRWQETNLGDFIADAYRSALDADVAVINGGGVRASLAQGPITYQDLLSVQPYGNELCLVEATGQTILDALEMGVSEWPEPSGGFMQVSGLTYCINTAIESSVVVDEYGNFKGVDGEYRVYNVKINGQPLDLDKTYTVASHNYMLLEAGDGMTMFANCPVLQEGVMIDNQSIIEYVRALGGIIGSTYANPEGQGRIVFTDGRITSGEESIVEEEKPTTEGSPKSHLAKTGDSTSTAGLLLLGALSALSASVAAAAKRRD